MPGSLELEAMPNGDYNVLKYLGMHFSLVPKLVGVTLALLVCFALLKYLYLSQTPSGVNEW